MKFIENVIQNTATLYLALLYLSYGAGIVVMEVLYLKKNRKKALMVVSLSIVVSCIACILVPTKYEVNRYRLQSLNVYEKSECIGTLPVLVDTDNKLAGIGYFVKNEEIGPVAYLLNAEIGKIVSEESSYDKEIRKALIENGISQDNFSGKTESYEKLKNMTSEKQFVSFSFSNLAVKYSMCVIPAVVSILVYIIFVCRQKKKMMLKKSKLKDL